MTSTLAPSTQRNYDSSFRNYIAFCRTKNLCTLPIHEFNLMLYTTKLSQTTSYSNIKVHISSIKHFAVLYQYHQNVPPLPRLYMLIRAMKRQHGKKFQRPQRLPITPPLMFQLKYYLSHSTYNTYDRIMLWAAFTCAFFGFLRSSEFVASFTQRFESESTLLFHDASIYNNHAQLNIKSSKTDPFRQGCIVRLSPTGNELCPIDALTKFLSRHCKKSGPLFTYSNGTFLTRRRLTTILNHALPSCSSSPISTHYFRIGAATTAAAAGFPRWLIQQLGRWNSDCFRIYLHIPNSTIDNVSTALANNSQPLTTWDPDLCE